MTKKILVTGATSRQANPDKNRRDVLVSWLIAETCRDLGYEVEHGRPGIQMDLSEFDHVFCGLAPFHALGASGIYGALSVFMRAYAENKLTMYLDDQDVGKIVNGAKTMSSDPLRFTKPFFVYRREYDIASQPEWNEWLLNGVKMLDEFAWPRVIVPAFPWVDKYQVLRAAPNATQPEFIDFSSFLPTYVSGPAEERERRWVTESMDDKWLSQQRVSWPLQRYGKGWDKRPTDLGLLEAYASSQGVLEEGPPHGWWTSRLGYAMQAGAVYSTRWQNVESLGDAFAHLPDAIEEMTDDDRRELAQAQRTAFEKHSTPKDEVRETVRRIVSGG